jgi:predicted ArsR family transcriptional regulator
MSRYTQNKAILDYVKNNGSISAREAALELGIMRLAARIPELESAGHEFVHETVYQRDDKGKAVGHYTRYRAV